MLLFVSNVSPFQIKPVKFFGGNHSLMQLLLTHKHLKHDYGSQPETLLPVKSLTMKYILYANWVFLLAKSKSENDFLTFFYSVYFMTTLHFSGWQLYP